MRRGLNQVSYHSPTLIFINRLSIASLMYHYHNRDLPECFLNLFCLNYSIILLYRSSGDRDEYFDISKFRYNRSSFVLTLCPAGLQIEL